MANGRVMWQWLRLIFTVFAIGYIAWYLASHSDELAGLRVFTATELALLMMLYLGDWAIRTVEFRLRSLMSGIDPGCVKTGSECSRRDFL